MPFGHLVEASVQDGLEVVEVDGLEVVAYPDRGAEAVHRLDVVDFPAVVVNDLHGVDLYEQGLARWSGRAAGAGQDERRDPR